MNLILKTESYRICSMASHVSVLGGAPGASICLRIFWNRIAFFCRFRVLGERTNGRSHAWKQDGCLKSFGLQHGKPSPLVCPQRQPGHVCQVKAILCTPPRNLTPDHKHAQLFEREMKHITSDGPRGADHLPLRPQQRVKRN